MIQEIGDMSVVELKKLIANIRAVIHMREWRMNLAEKMRCVSKSPGESPKIIACDDRAACFMVPSAPLLSTCAGSKS